MLVIAVDGLADVLDGPLLATIDDQDMEKEVDAANMAVAATPGKRQQQMQQQQ